MPINFPPRRKYVKWHRSRITATWTLVVRMKNKGKERTKGRIKFNQEEVRNMRWVSIAKEGISP